MLLRIRIGTSKGVALLSFSIRSLQCSLRVQIVPSIDTSILLRLGDMGPLGIYLDTFNNTIPHRSSGMKSFIVRCRSNHYTLFNSYIFYRLTLAELCSLHRRFGHPCKDRLMTKLNRADWKWWTRENKNFGIRSRKVWCMPLVGSDTPVV